VSTRDRALRHSGNATSRGTQPISPSGHFAHFAPVNGLSNQAPGRQPASRLRAPCASIIAFDPRGRCSCKLGRENRTSGTGTSLISGKRPFAEPCRPSIHSTSARANSGTSDHGTPADVTSSSSGSFALRVVIVRLPPSKTLRPESRRLIFLRQIGCQFEPNFGSGAVGRLIAMRKWAFRPARLRRPDWRLIPRPDCPPS
jgi:hypothetical protein